MVWKIAVEEGLKNLPIEYADRLKAGAFPFERGRLVGAAFGGDGHLGELGQERGPTHTLKDAPRLS